MYQVKIKNQLLEVKDDMSILQSARKKLVNLPYGCANGGCGMCKVKVVRGEYELKKCSKGALNDVEREKGYILSCKAFPRSDMELQLME